MPYKRKAHVVFIGSGDVCRAMLAASLAAPLALLATWAVALLTIAIGVLKLVPSTNGNEPVSAALLRLSTGGVIDAPSRWSVEEG